MEFYEFLHFIYSLEHPSILKYTSTAYIFYFYDL